MQTFLQQEELSPNVEEDEGGKSFGRNQSLKSGGNPQMTEKLKQQSREGDRVKKLINLYSGHDLKFDRDTKIKRAGTPVSEM